MPHLEEVKLCKKACRSACTVVVSHCPKLVSLEMGDEVFMNCSKWVMEGVEALQTVTFSMGNMKKLSSITIKGAGGGYG